MQPASNFLTSKSFSSQNKYAEHCESAKHQKLSEAYAQKPVEKKEVITTLENENICLMCNVEQTDVAANFEHMFKEHNLEIPFFKYLKSQSKAIRMMAIKVFKYFSCLGCDTTLKSGKAVQSHMIDKNHCFINKYDIEEHLSKMYDVDLMDKEVKNKDQRCSDEFQYIKISYMLDNDIEVTADDIEIQEKWRFKKTDDSC